MSVPIWIVIVVGTLACIRLYFKLTSARCRSKVTLLGKTALVTGGSSGIGYQLAIDLAARGCRVILAQRCTDEKLKETLVRETNNPHISLEFVDFSSFESVKRLANKLKSTTTQLDILINNAGVGITSDMPTEDGFNITWQINYYSPFLLTHLLVDLLKKSNAGRIIFTSSVTSYAHNMRMGDVEGGRIKPKISVLDYSNTKFLAILAADYFAEKLKESNITSNSYHPGIVTTPIFEKSAQNYKGIMDFCVLQFVIFLKMLSMKNVEEGVQTALHLAIANEVANVTGEFFGETTPSWKPRGANNKKFRENIWKATENAVGMKPEEHFESEKQL